MLLLFCGKSVGDPVDNDGQEHDAQARGEPVADLDTVDGFQDFQAKSSGADHGSDNHHGKSHHGRLVHPHHDTGESQRQLDVEQHLAVAGPKGSGRLHDGLRDTPYTHIGEPDDGRDRIDHRGENGRHFAQAEQHHGRDKVDEAGHGLHSVKDRAEDRLKTVAASHENSYGEADEERHYHRGEHDSQGGHSVIPESEDPHHENEAGHDYAVPPFTHGPPGRHGHDDKDHRPRYPQEDPINDDQGLEKGPPDDVEESDRIDQDPVHDNVDPLLHGDVQFFWKLKHFRSPDPLQGLPGSCFQ